MDLTGRWPLPEATDVRDALLAAYAGPDRGYHDTRHLTEVLDRLDELPPTFDRLPVVLAAWFHDAVYDGAPDAEERSAAWAAEAVAGSPALADEVARLVRLTAHHRPAPDDPNGCALCDADLAILAAPPDRYAEYTAGVRHEYAALPDDVFRAGRLAVLTDLLDRPHLFATSYARTRWEPTARANLAREVAVLRGRSGG